MNRRGLWLNLGLKALLVALLLFSLLSGLERFEGKAMLARALTYPLATLVVPIAWHFRGRPRPYPHLIDALVVLPFVIDTGGNVQDLMLGGGGTLLGATLVSAAWRLSRT